VDQRLFLINTESGEFNLLVWIQFLVFTKLLGLSAHLPFMTLYNHIPHFSVLATRECMKRTVSVACFF